MKRYIILICFIAVCLFSCGKGGSPSPDHNSNTNTNSGGNGNTGNNGGNGNTNNYIVKTVGISRVRFALDGNNKLVLAELIGGGNRIILKAGSGYNMEFSNPNNYEPSVNTDGDTLPSANYPALPAAIDNGSILDTTAITFKLKGFDKAKTGYNQLNLVLCKEVRIQTVTGTYNFEVLAFSAARTTFNNNYYKSIFTSPINVSYVELASPLSAKPYITRDAVVTDIISTTDPNGDPLTFTAGDGFWTSIKFFLNTSTPLNVGSNFKISLVNADKSTFSPEGDGTEQVYPSNVKHGAFGVANIPEPQDTVNNVFVRISGFDASKTGYNQLRLILVDDGGVGSGGIDVLQGIWPEKVITVPLMQKAYTFKGFQCVGARTD